MRKVGISMLTKNMVLAKPLYHAGKLLLKAGGNNIDKYKAEFVRIGIPFVYIEDDNSEGIVIPDVISEEVRTDSKKKFREITGMYQKRSILNVAALSNSVKAITEEVFLAQDAALSLSDISSKDDELTRHSVNTAVYAAMIGKAAGYDKTMLQKLVYGALLHDIGTVKLNPKLFMKRTPWDDSELAEYKTHAQIGYDALKKVNDITELSKIIVLSHHERLDGSGYPEHKKGDAIHEVVRIVSIADEFDALVMGGENREKSYTVNGALEHLMKNSINKLDATLCAYFMQKIAVYPNGCMIKLSNNCYGLVKEQNKNMPYRPVVRLITDEYGKPISHKEIDLINELSLTIVESEMECKSAIA